MSITSKDEKVHKLSKRILHRVDQESILAYLGETSELSDSRHDSYAGLCGCHFRYGLCIPSSDDFHLHHVISLYYE